MSGTNFGTQQVLKNAGVNDLWGWMNSTPYFVKNASTATFDKVMGSYLPKATSDQDVLDDWAGMQILRRPHEDPHLLDGNRRGHLHRPLLVP